MRKKIFIVLMVILMLVPLSVASAKGKPLRFETTYNFVGHLREGDGEGRTLVWLGEVFVSGGEDSVGTAEWWMIFPEGGVDTGNVNHWEDAIWKIKFHDETFIEGEERGSTTWLLHKGEAYWRANGVVTDASDTDLIGRPIHDGGFVDLTTMSGVGKIQINK